MLKYQPSRHKNTRSNSYSHNKLLGACLIIKQNCLRISINVQFLVTIINIFLNASDAPREARQAVCIFLLRAEKVKPHSTLAQMSYYIVTPGVKLAATSQRNKHHNWERTPFFLLVCQQTGQARVYYGMYI